MLWVVGKYRGHGWQSKQMASLFLASTFSKFQTINKSSFMQTIRVQEVKSNCTWCKRGKKSLVWCNFCMYCDLYSVETLTSTYVSYNLIENPKVISPSSFPQLLIFNGCCDSQWQLSNDHSSSCSIILLFIVNNQCQAWWHFKWL